MNDKPNEDTSDKDGASNVDKSLANLVDNLPVSVYVYHKIYGGLYRTHLNRTVETHSAAVWEELNKEDVALVIVSFSSGRMFKARFDSKRRLYTNWIHELPSFDALNEELKPYHLLNLVTLS